MSKRARFTVLAVLWGAASGCMSDAEAEGCGDDGLSCGQLSAASMKVDVQHPVGGASDACSAPDAYLGYSFHRFDVPERYGNQVFHDFYRRMGGGKAVKACTSPLSACGAAGVDTADLVMAFTHADVVAAFDEAGANLEVVFGARSSSGSVDANGLSMVIYDPRLHKRIGVGSACNDAVDCRAITPGIAALVALLQQLDEEQGREGPCAGFLESANE